MFGPRLPVVNQSVEKAVPQGRHKWEVADIFRQYGDAYRLIHPLPPTHLKVLHDIEVCRTAYLGGHIEQCDSCGFDVTLVALKGTPITPAAIGTAQSARH
jgi:hypothetical protein